VTPEQLRTQKIVVALAFVAAAFSLSAVLMTAMRTGRIEATPLLGGLFMLALGLAGWSTVRRRANQPPSPPGPPASE
jgi:hypothetical protein